LNLELLSVLPNALKSKMASWIKEIAPFYFKKDNFNTVPNSGFDIPEKARKIQYQNFNILQKLYYILSYYS